MKIKKEQLREDFENLKQSVSELLLVLLFFAVMGVIAVVLLIGLYYYPFIVAPLVLVMLFLFIYTDVFDELF